jgi:hypothetical protein
MLDGWPGQSPAGFVPRMLRIGRTLTLAEAVLGYRQNSGLRSGLPSEQVDVSNDFRRYLLKPLVLYRLRQCSSGIMIQVVRSSDLNSWPARGRPHTLRQGTVAMARALDEIVRLDRRWFWAHPQRQHRCRWPETAELDLCDCDRGARLVMVIRHLGRGCLAYQPVIFQGALPASEEPTAALFTLAATSPEPIPVLAQREVRRLRYGLPQQRQRREVGDTVGGGQRLGFCAERAAPG